MLHKSISPWCNCNCSADKQCVRILNYASTRHDVDHFGNATGSGDFTDADQLAVFTGCEGFRLTSLYSFISKSVTSARVQYTY